MKRDSTARARHARRKGKSFEREVANAFKKVYPNARRGLGQARAAGEVPDVALAGPFWIECKAHKRPNIIHALEQAEGALEEHLAERPGKGPSVPMAVTKADRTVPMVTLYLDAFLELLMALKDLGADERYEAMVNARTGTSQEALPKPKAPGPPQKVVAR